MRRAPQAFGLFVIVLVLTLSARADDVITNIMSAVASFQFSEDASSEVLTNGGLVSPIASYQYQEDLAGESLAGAGIESPVASFQFLENFATQALTNGGIESQIASYQYLEWPGDDLVTLQYSPIVSFYFQFIGTPTLTIVQTSRTPTLSEMSPSPPFPPPSSLQLEVFENGSFVANGTLDTNSMTTVLTHGWIPLNPGNGNDLFEKGGPQGWPTEMAVQLRASGIEGNIVAWNWTNDARSSALSPAQAGDRAPTNGIAMGQALLSALGPHYSKRIHFVGHSFGTLVNSYAANFLQGTNYTTEPVSPTPWPASNMLMTLFDEAEVGTDKSLGLSQEGIANLYNLAKALVTGNGGFVNTASPRYHPLPKQFAWAENYLSAFGLPHAEAVNIILTNGLPSDAPNLQALFDEFGNYHVYPVSWYKRTVESDNSAVGFIWPFLWGVGDPAFMNAPTNGSVYVQTSASSEWDVTATNWQFATNWINSRFRAYRTSLGSSFAQIVGEALTENGAVTPQAELDPNAIDSVNWIFQANSSPAQPIFLPQKAERLPTGWAEKNIPNIPAYMWMTLFVPSNAVSFSFNYRIQGNWQNDSLAVSWAGTNVISIAGSEIQSNITFSSGPIDVSSFEGQTNEFFVGIVGGTSQDAQVTIENIRFTLLASPTLQIQTAERNLTLSWPVTADDFSLQWTSDLTEPRSWNTCSNVPTIVNLQNVLTNDLRETNRFYRLIAQ